MDTIDASGDGAGLAPVEAQRQPPTPENNYFARLPFGDESIAGEVEERFRNFERYLQSCGLATLIERLARHYYGMDDRGITSHSVAYEGERSEFQRTHINHLRSLVRMRQNLALNERIALDAEAGNADYEAIVQSRKANALIEYEMWERGLSEKFDEAIEKAAHQAWAFLVLGWNPRDGETLLPAMAPGEQEVKTGALEHRVYGAYDVAFDPRLRRHNPPYYILRDRPSVVEMEAEYPHLAGKLGAEPETPGPNVLRLDVGFIAPYGFAVAEDDGKCVRLELRHARTPACPEGRRTVVVGGYVAEDGPLPYADMCVVPFYESVITDTPFFYCEAFDLLAPQHAHNMLSSIAATNARAGGVGVIATPDGSTFEADMATQGLALVKWPAGTDKPEVLHLASTPPEVYENMDRTERSMEKTYGVNSVARGETTGANASGSQLALLQATSMQAATPLRRRVDDSCGRVAMALISIARDYMEHELAVVVYGEHDATVEESVTGSQLSRIRRVRVKPGNILGKTLHGRIAIADTLLERGLIADVRSYYLVLETGRLEPVTKAPASERSLVQLENQQMIRGEMPIVLAHDDDAMHIREHKLLLDSPAARAPNSPLLAIVTEHIEQHEMNAVSKSTQRPWLLELLGQQPLQSALAMGGAMPPPGLGGGGGPPGGAPPPPGGGMGGGMGGGAMPPGEGGGAPAPSLPPGSPDAGKMPNMPMNPMTGEQWNPADGGSAVPE